MHSFYRINVVVLVSVLISIPALAEKLYEFKSNSSGCTLQVHDGSEWGPIDNHALDGRQFSVKPYKKRHFTAKVNGFLYLADSVCFKEVKTAAAKVAPVAPVVAAAPVAAAPVDAAPKPTPQPVKQKVAAKKEPAPQAVPVATPYKPSRGSPDANRTFSIDFQGSYLFMMANDVKFQTRTVGISTVSLNEMSSMVGGTVRLGYQFARNHEFGLGVNFDTGKQTGSLAGGSGNTEAKYKIVDIALGYRLLLGGTDFVPFLQGSLGYSMLSYDLTIAGTSSNTTFTSTGTGISFGLGAGFYYYFSDAFRLVTDIAYRDVTATQMKVKTTNDTTFFPADSNVGALILSHLAVNLGFGLCF